MQDDVHGIRRWIALCLGLLLCGSICWAILPALASPRGATGPSILQADSPVMAIIAVILAIALSSVIAGIVGRFVNAAVGVFTLGGGLSILAMRSETVTELVFSNGSLHSVGFETILLAGILAGAVWIVFRIAGPLPDIEPEVAGHHPHPWFSADAAKAAAAGVLVLPIVWLIAQSPMKGQVLAAAVLGSALAVMVGRLLSPHVQPMLLLISPCIFAALGHFIAAMTIASPLDESFAAGTLPRLLLPMPLDYAAATLVGGSMGLNWARSFLHHEDDEQETARTSTRVSEPA